jgi:hypothetical protein
MKKTAALFLAAFYLLLTTGMFVCAMSCAAEKLTPKSTMPTAGMQGKCCCQKNKAAACPQQHGSFVIKENVKPGYQIRFSLPLLTLQPVPFAFFGLQSTVIAPVSLLNDNHPPPGLSGKSIIIQYRSFLI